MPMMPPLDLGPGGDADLAASLEGMMKQFTDQLAAGGGDGSEKALDEMFQKMMMGDLDPSMMMPSASNSNAESLNSNQPSQSQQEHSNDTANDGNASTRSHATPKNNRSKRNNNSTNNNNKNKNEPDVDESINRLLDGINHATNAPLPNPNMPAPPGMMPPNVDPAQFESFSQDMMQSIMGEFEKMGNADDSNDVVDGVMKQLLDKDLMYEPMKEVCGRFPKWLAENRDELTEKEYERYGTQYQYFQKIVRVYETEPENFARLMELMQDIQEYGQPPVDIIRDLAPELEFDEQGMPIMDPTMGGGNGVGGGMMPGMGMPGMPFPGNGEQCCIS